MLKILRAGMGQLAPHLSPRARRALARARLLDSTPDMLTNPRTAQETLPLLGIDPEGFAQVTAFDYAAALSVGDLNLSLSSEEEQEKMLKGFEAWLNGLDGPIQWYVSNESLDPQRLLSLVPEESPHRCLHEYRDWLGGLAAEHGITDRRRLLVVSTRKSGGQDVRIDLRRKVALAESGLKQIGAEVHQLTGPEYVQALWQACHPGEPATRFIMPDEKRWLQGIGLNDLVAPDGIRFGWDHVQLGPVYRRYLCIQDYPATLDDLVMMDLLSQTHPMQLSMHITPIPQDKALRWLNKRIEGMTANKLMAKREKRETPWDLQRQQKAAEQLRDQLANGRSKLFRLAAYIGVTGQTMEELNNRTRTISDLLNRRMVRHGVLRFRQEAAWASCLPVACDQVRVERTLTTQVVSVLSPFSVATIWDAKGLVLGLNRVTGGLICQDRRGMNNPAGFVLGQPGAGKSAALKAALHRAALCYPDDDILILDWEGEYEPLVRDLGGEVVMVAPGTGTSINAFEIDPDYDPDAGDPIGAKSAFLLDLFDRVIGPLSAEDKSILDRATRLCFQHFGLEATWKLHQAVLKEQPDRRANRLATAMELYVDGSMSLFADQTTVNSRARVISYDLRALNEALRPLAYQVLLDLIWTRCCRNKRQGRRTWVVTDEFHMMLRHASSSRAYGEWYKRVRKRGVILTAATQNVEEVLRNDEARYMLANSTWMLLLEQSATDLAALSQMLGLPASAHQYVSGVNPGQGLLRVRNLVVPIHIRLSPHEQELADTRAVGVN